MPVLLIIVLAVIVIGLATAVVVPAVLSDPLPPAPRPEIPAAVAPFEPGLTDDQGEATRAGGFGSDLGGLPGWSEGPLETYEEPEDEGPSSDPAWEPEEAPARTGGMAGALADF